MYAEERRRYHRNHPSFNNIIETIKAMNRVRIGEEEDISNLIDYLTNTTSRE